MIQHDKVLDEGVCDYVVVMCYGKGVWGDEAVRGSDVILCCNVKIQCE